MAKTTETKKVIEPVKRETAKTVETTPTQETATIEQLQNQIAEMQKMFATMNKTAPVTTNKESKSIGSTKIKVMSLLPYQLNLTTEPLGGGKAYSFYNYGESQKIKFSDLEDIVHNHRKNMEDGIFYICDRNAIEELELTDEYEALVDKIGIDAVVDLKDQLAIEMFLSLSDYMKESVARQIAEKINEGKEYDLNLLAEIQRRSEIDIITIAEGLKI